VFNLWIYQRRSSCSARLQHGGSSALTPMEGLESVVEWSVARAVAGIDQGPSDNVLPFRSPRDAVSREPAVPADRKRRGRPKGRGHGKKNGGKRD
jgi:hypothetical protein